MKLTVAKRVVRGVILLAVFAQPTWAFADELTPEAQRDVKLALSLAAAPKVAIAELWLIRKMLPMNRSELGMSLLPTDTGPVVSLDVQGGVIITTFGDDSQPELRGKTIVHIPYIAVDGRFTWLCGYAKPALGSTEAGSEYGVPVGHIKPTIDEKYLPETCLSSFRVPPNQSLQPMGER